MSGVCSFFLQGKCTFGTTCRYTHQAPAQKICPHFLKGSCQFGDKCRNFHDTRQGARKAENSTCTFFLRGECRYGSTCKMSHTSDSGARSSIPTKSPVTQDSHLHTVQCPYFSRGQCRYGEACMLLHSIAEKPQINCRYFLSGTCSKGDDCPFLHNTEKDRMDGPVLSEKPPIRERQVQDNPGTDKQSHERPEFHCTVKFGAGAMVEEIVTPFESRRLVLSNLPPNITKREDLLASIPSPGPDILITIHPTTNQSTATFHFPTVDKAANYLAVLQATADHKLAARFDIKPGSVETGSDTVFNCRKVKISWWSPRSSAVVHYDTPRIAANQAKRMDGKKFGGMEVKASYSSVGYRGSTSVLLQNLPPIVVTEKLRGFCGIPTTISLKEPAIDESTPNIIERMLENFGPLEAFEILPVPPSSTKQFAFVRYATAEAAEAATRRLHNKPQEFLAGNPLWVEQVFSVKFTVRGPVFAKVKSSIEALQKQSAPETRIHYYASDANGRLLDVVKMSIEASSAKALGHAKAELEKLAQGEVISDDGKVLWDDFLDTAEGKAFVNLTNTDDNLQFFFIVNARIRKVRVAGAPEDRAAGKNLLVVKLREVESMRHILSLERNVIWRLMKGGLQLITSQVGEGKVTLDIVSRRLTVNGDEADVDRARRAILDLGRQNAIHTTTKGSGADCPACFTEVVDPLSLECGHVFCTECIQLYAKSVCSDFKLLTCPAVRNDQSTCNTPLSLSTIHDLLTSAEEDTLLRSAFLFHVASKSKEYQFCPTPDCEMVYRSASEGKMSVIQCPSCLVRVCTKCSVEIHEGLSCAEFQDQRGGGLKALQRWREEHGVKQCPACHVDIEKNGGCNHMTCAVCKIHICWICMKTFDDEDSRHGVYAHIRNSHGLDALFQ